jgi:hypothetical protein
MSSPAVVYCTKCGTDIPDDSQFCRKCGQPVTSTMPPNPRTQTAPASPATTAPTRGNRLERIPLFLALLVIVALLGWFIDHQMQQARTTPLPSQSAVQQAPPVRLHRVTIGTGALTVAAANSIYYQLPVPATATVVKVQGHFTATGGTGNDIEVYLLNQDEFTNWQNGHATATFYNSGRVTVGDIDATLPNDAATYYLVFNNKFSLITPKAVQENITMTYFTR